MLNNCLLCLIIILQLAIIYLVLNSDSSKEEYIQSDNMDLEYLRNLDDKISFIMTHMPEADISKKPKKKNAVKSKTMQNYQPDDLQIRYDIRTDSYKLYVDENIIIDIPKDFTTNIQDYIL